MMLRRAMARRFLCIHLKGITNERPLYRTHDVIGS